MKLMEFSLGPSKIGPQLILEFNSTTYHHFRFFFVPEDTRKTSITMNIIMIINSNHALCPDGDSGKTEHFFSR